MRHIFRSALRLIATLWIFLPLKGLARADDFGPAPYEGAWVLVESGCDLHLSEQRMKSLAHGNGRSFFDLTTLEISDGHYRSRMQKGTGCKPEDSSPIQYDPRFENPIICAGEATTAGTVQMIAPNELFFDGQIVKSELGRREGLGTQFKQLTFERREGLLITRTTALNHCARTKLIRYWIPHPGS